MSKKRSAQLVAVGLLTLAPTAGSYLAANAILTLDVALPWQRIVLIAIMGWYLTVGAIVTLGALVMFWFWLFDLSEEEDA